MSWLVVSFMLILLFISGVSCIVSCKRCILLLMSFLVMLCELVLQFISSSSRLCASWMKMLFCVLCTQRTSKDDDILFSSHPSSLSLPCTTTREEDLVHVSLRKANLFCHDFVLCRVFDLEISILIQERRRHSWMRKTVSQTRVNAV